MAACRHAIDSEISCAFGKSPSRSSSCPQSKLRKRSTSRRSHRTKPAASVSAKKRRLRWWRGSDPGRPVAPEPEATGRGSEETSASSSARIRIRRELSFFPGPEVSSLSLASHGVHCTGALACARLRSTRARLATASTAAAVACAVDIARRWRRWQQWRRRQPAVATRRDGTLVRAPGEALERTKR
eukprot:scaffold34487_cov51-Phaeocystis_antarctica.AAC.2